MIKEIEQKMFLFKADGPPGDPNESIDPDFADKVVFDMRDLAAKTGINLDFLDEATRRVADMTQPKPTGSGEEE